MRGIIRVDIDTIIGQAYTYDSFLMLLRRNGYEVRRSPNRKYTMVKPPGAKRAIRMDSLGEGYTEADILLRLSRQRHGGIAPPIIAHTVKRYRMKGKLSTVQKKENYRLSRPLSPLPLSATGKQAEEAAAQAAFLRQAGGHSFGAV